MALISIADWSAAMGISRQAGRTAVKRCGITVRDHKVDDVQATRLYREHTRPRMNMVRTPVAIAAPAAIARPVAKGDAQLEALLSRASRLAVLAFDAINRGSFDLVEQQLRDAIEAVPPSARERLLMPRAVWDALTGNVAAELECDGPNLSKEEAAKMGDFWASVAAGEVRRA